MLRNTISAKIGNCQAKVQNLFKLMYKTTEDNTEINHVVSESHHIKKTLHIKLMRGKALRKRRLREKTAASVLLKLFISSNE